MCSVSAADCVKIADAGLTHLHENFELIRDDKTIKLSEAFSTIKGSFEVGVMKGEKPLPKEFKCEVPYKKGYSLMKPCNTPISGKELLEKVKAWAEEVRDTVLRQPQRFFFVGFQTGLLRGLCCG